MASRVSSSECMIISPLPTPVPSLTSQTPTPPAADVNVPYKVEKARFVRIKSIYNWEEQRVVTMSAPYRGFSAYVRFHCRARLHHVEIIKFSNEPAAPVIVASASSV